MDQHGGNGGGPQLPAWFEEVDHTADTGFVVRGRDLPELLARAAWGLFSILADLRTVEPREQIELEVTAPDPEALLVRWLSELNHRHVTARRLFCRFDVVELTGQRLKAVVWGEPVDLARHTIFTEVKAVTYHHLRLDRTAEGWEAQVILDL